MNSEGDVRSKRGVLLEASRALLGTARRQPASPQPGVGNLHAASVPNASLPNAEFPGSFYTTVRCCASLYSLRRLAKVGNDRGTQYRHGIYWLTEVRKPWSIDAREDARLATQALSVRLLFILRMLLFAACRRLL